jgi:hypothetical protein
MRTTSSLFLIVPFGIGGIVASQACSSDSGVNDTSVLTASGGHSSGTAQGGGNAGGSSGTFVGSGGVGGDEGCVNESAEATIVNKPVDIIIAIDNSGSMSAEIQEVEKQINKNFAAIIDAANPPIDYRVIMVSGFGAFSSQRICVAAPLGGIPDNDMNGHCDSIPSQPVNTAKFFHHSVSVGSHDALCRLLSSHDTADQFGLQPNGYKDVLRPEAFKFFLVITDDGVSCSFNNASYNDGNSVTGGTTAGNLWDTNLMALNPAAFGVDATDRNYTFWSIIALAPHMPTAMKPYGDPHPPDATVAPIITAKCTPSAVDPGTGYQQLSLITGGYRYPTCGLDYTDIFTLMAEGVIAGAQTPCVFDIPEPPNGQTLDLDTVKVKYSSGGSPVKTLDQVSGPGDCDANSFYIENEQIHICPDACTVIQADEESKIDIIFGCAIIAQ